MRLLFPRKLGVLAVLAIVQMAVGGGCSPQDALPESEASDDTKQPVQDAGKIQQRTDTSRGIHTPEPDIFVDPDTGPPWSYATCTQLFACAQASCGTSSEVGCEKACVAKAKDTAQLQFVSYASCMDEVCRKVVCSDGKDPACIAQCAAQRCTPMLLPCLEPTKTGSNGCSVLFKAEDGCAKAQDSFKCLAAAYGTLASAQQEAFLAMHGCLAKSAAADRWGDCLEVVLQCASDGKVGPQTCVNMLKCDAQCGTTDHLYLCQGGCKASGAKAVQGHYIALRKCMFEAENGKAGAGACFASLKDCAAPSGKQGCDASWKCTNACKNKGGTSAIHCAAECLEKATPAAADKFVTWWACREAVCKPKCVGDKKCVEACYASTCGGAESLCVAD